jgi:hypothetical protein
MKFIKNVPGKRRDIDTITSDTHETGGSNFMFGSPFYALL